MHKERFLAALEMTSWLQNHVTCSTLIKRGNNVHKIINTLRRTVNSGDPARSRKKKAGLKARLCTS